MTESFTLETQQRTVKGKKVKQLRKNQIVPLNVYGSSLQPRSLQADYRQLEIVLLNAGGTNLIELQIAGNPVSVLAREVQRDPIRGTIEHVDFFAVDMESRVNLDVPIVYENESPAVTTQGGMLVVGANNLSIETLPSHLPDQFVVDLSILQNIGDSISVGDLVLDKVITVHNSPDETLVSVIQPAAARGEDEELDEDAELLEEEEIGEPEVIGREEEAI